MVFFLSLTPDGNIINNEIKPTKKTKEKLNNKENIIEYFYKKIKNKGSKNNFDLIYKYDYHNSSYNLLFFGFDKGKNINDKFKHIIPNQCFDDIIIIKTTNNKFEFNSLQNIKKEEFNDLIDSISNSTNYKDQHNQQLSNPISQNNNNFQNHHSNTDLEQTNDEDLSTDYDTINDISLDNFEDKNEIEPINILSLIDKDEIDELSNDQNDIIDSDNEEIYEDDDDIKIDDYTDLTDELVYEKYSYSKDLINILLHENIKNDLENKKYLLTELDIATINF